MSDDASAVTEPENKQADTKRLVIIDGYGLLYRAFFATRYLSTSDGKPTNALFGFTSMLFTILEKIRPHAIVVALDAPGKTFRHAEYSEYKATRKETADELKVQLVEARDLIAALGIPQLEKISFEADDIVGTISKRAEEAGYETTIVTGDLDSLQLVDEKVSVLTPKQGITETMLYRPADVREKLGVDPHQVVDFKAIKGDTSDNIPGVAGIGEKGAAELIALFGSIEQILERFDEVPPKYQKKITGQEEVMKLSKWLATIDRNMEIEYDFAPFVLTPEQVQRAKAMLERFEFRAHVRTVERVLGPYVAGAGFEATAPSVEVVSEKIEFNKKEVGSLPILQSAVSGKEFGLLLANDVSQESSGTGDLFAQPTKKAYVSVGKDVFVTSDENGLRLLAQNAGRAIVHDSKSLVRAADTIGLDVDRPVAFDPMLAGYVLQSGRSAYAIRDLIQGYTDYAPPTVSEEMAACLLPLAKAMRDRLEKEGQTKVLSEVEQPLAPILADMESVGIATNRTQLKEFSKELQIAIEQSTAKIYELAGQEFTIGSPKQLGEILFDKLGIPGATKTKTGYATGAEILVQIAPQYEIAGEVMTWRELTKLKSTYTDALERLIREDGRIHTTYNQTVAATGRLSSNDPNLQNIPIRTELGRGIRKAFEAAPGYQLLSLDYSQIELRVLAHMCEEPALKSAFENHEDVHTATARIMFHLGSEQPSKDQRRMAKLLNYAVLYGVTDFGLANQLGGGFSRSEARELINLYNDRFPTVKEFTKSVVTEARSKGFTTTLIGRRRYFPDIHAARMQDRQYAERQAMNAPIQGTAADMIKLAMIEVVKLLEGRESRMLLNVHDELVFELWKGEEDLIEPIRTVMETALPLGVPVEVDAKIGSNWNDMTEIARPS